MRFRLAFTRLRDSRQSAPGRELREYVQELPAYVKSVGIALEGAQIVQSSGDMQKIQQAVDELKAKVLGNDNLKSRRAELVRKLGTSSHLKATTGLNCSDCVGVGVPWHLGVVLR